MKKILNVTEAASLLSIHKDTLRQWESDGVVASFRTPGGHRRFFADDIQKLIDESEGTVEKSTQYSKIEARLDAIEQQIKQMEAFLDLIELIEEAEDTTNKEEE